MTTTTSIQETRDLMSNIMSEISLEKKFDLVMLTNWKEKLIDMRWNCQYDLDCAIQEEKWQLAGELREVISECKTTTDKIQVAILSNLDPISVGNSEIIRMNQIRGEIRQAVNNEQIIKGVINLLVFLRKIIIV